MMFTIVKRKNNLQKQNTVHTNKEIFQKMLIAIATGRIMNGFLNFLLSLLISFFHFFLQ